MPTSGSRWAEYVAQHTTGQTQGQIAARTGLRQSTISRWLSGKEPQPSAINVVRFARGCGVPPVEALVAAGVISADEAGAVA